MKYVEFFPSLQSNMTHVYLYIYTYYMTLGMYLWPVITYTFFTEHKDEKKSNDPLRM